MVLQRGLPRISGVKVPAPVLLVCFTRGIGAAAVISGEASLETGVISICLLAFGKASPKRNVRDIPAGERHRQFT